jgi:hypothetical protein
MGPLPLTQVTGGKIFMEGRPDDGLGLSIVAKANAKLGRRKPPKGTPVESMRTALVSEFRTVGIGALLGFILDSCSWYFSGPLRYLRQIGQRVSTPNTQIALPVKGTLTEWPSQNWVLSPDVKSFDSIFLR